MIVICIVDNNSALTLGKEYCISGTSLKGEYLILDDHDIKRWYWTGRFKTLEEIRDEQINSILL